MYTRAEIESASIGQVELRRAYTRPLNLPWWDCPGEAFSCEVDRVYGQVYSLRFTEDVVEGGVAGERAVRDRGSLLLAFEFSPEAENLFEEKLVRHLAGLSATAYAHPRAGMAYLREPLGTEPLAQSTQPAWICKELEGKYAFNLMIPEKDHTRRSYARPDETAERACRGIERAAEGVVPETFRTLPDVRALVRHTVRLESASTLDGLTWANELAPRTGMSGTPHFTWR